MTARELIIDASSLIARRDAETLLLHLLDRDRAWLLAHGSDVVPSASVRQFEGWVERRAAHEPLQYITGRQEFFGLDFAVEPAVLIPRPETEHLVEQVLTWAEAQSSSPLRVLDVGTGSGAIALALAAKLPEASITAIDLSAKALQVAQANARRLGLEGRVQFLQADLLSAIAADVASGQRWDAIVSNPPYVPSGDLAEMQPEVRDHEPHSALFAGEDGMDVYRRLIPQAHAALRLGGLLAMEFGYAQQPLMERLFSEQSASAWRDLRFTADLQGIPRVIEATRA